MDLNNSVIKRLWWVYFCIEKKNILSRAMIWYKFFTSYDKNSHLLVILKVMFANSVDPDQTAPLGTVWSGSTLFACMQK